MQRPSFIITIDTEGDNSWKRSGSYTTENARYLPRFQELCERHGLRPTYLTNYEMAIEPRFIEMARDAERRGWAEVGMHLHAWHSPPFEPRLSANDDRNHPYLIEYPIEVMQHKVSLLTDLLQDSFGHEITSHRAGRWSFDAAYASVLVERGYLVDCSLTPHVTWASQRGDPSKAGGSDFRFAPSQAFRASRHDVTQAGHGGLIEVPMTIIPRLPLSHRAMPAFALRQRRVNGLAKRILPNDWLRPAPGNLETMQRVLRRCLAEGRDYAMFMTHSSELMPGGSPYFPTSQHIERLYDMLDSLFGEVATGFDGVTLSDYARQFRAGTAVPGISNDRGRVA